MPAPYNLRIVMMENGSFVIYDLPISIGYCDAYFYADNTLMAGEYKNKGCTGVLKLKRNSDLWFEVQEKGVALKQKQLEAP